MDAQQVFKSMFKAQINEDYSISTDIDRYQVVLEHALSIVDLIGTGIYSLESNLNLNIGKMVLVSNIDIKIGSNRDINKEHKKLPKTPPGLGKAEGPALKMDKTIKNQLAVQHDQIDNPEMFSKNHNDKKLAITIFMVGAGLNAYHFLEGLNNRGLAWAMCNFCETIL